VCSSDLGRDLANLDPFKFYLKTAGKNAKRPLSAETISLKGSGSLHIANKIVKLSQQKYTKRAPIVRLDNPSLAQSVPLVKS
jgi:hypothetical protein